MGQHLYDAIGLDYANLRRPDPRIAAAIEDALGDARSVVNVGAGAGSYEPAGRDVVAVEPSAAMIAQRAQEAARAVQGGAEDLPFADDSFDAAMAVLTVHHWSDQAKGMAEMRRVSRQSVVIVTFDPAARPWLTDYLPGLADLDEAIMPPMEWYAQQLGAKEGALRIDPLPIPRDCTDGFLYAYWARPAAYLDPAIRRGSSSFWKLAETGDLEEGLAQLERDLADGTWDRRYGALLEHDTLDCGYRVVRFQSD
jgi:SAM-dependent methyltransferase